MQEFLDRDAFGFGNRFGFFFVNGSTTTRFGNENGNVSQIGKDAVLQILDFLFGGNDADLVRRWFVEEGRLEFLDGRNLVDHRLSERRVEKSTILPTRPPNY